MNNRNHNPKLPSWPALFLLTSLTAALTGCAAGPDFQRPAPPAVTGYTSTERLVTIDSPGAHGAQQQFVVAPVPVEWWKALHSEKLTRLIDQAFQASPTLAAAQATLRQAQETYAAQAGSTLYPQVDASLGGQRQRINPSALGQTGDARVFNLYNTSVGVNYKLDLAGGNRRALEALAAQSDYQRFQLAGVRLTLAANIATTAITQAGFSRQIATVESMLRAQEEQLELARKRVRLGLAAPDDVLGLQTQLEQTRASIPPLRNQLQQNEHLLAVLVGRAPGAEGLPSFTLDEFTLPPDLPLVVPSDLVRTRPDILGAEALLHAANAEYGVAVSRLYPQINLSANLGSQALTTGALFGSGSTVWSLVGQLTQPLFNAGLPAEKRAALAAFDAAAAKYQEVVLESLRNVADVLRALENDSERLSALFTADIASQGLLNSSQHRYALGAASYYDLLIAQQQFQQTRLDLYEAQARRMVNSVAFYQAMGGGIYPSQSQ